MTVSNAAEQGASNEPSEPLADLGVAPGASDADKSGDHDEMTRTPTTVSAPKAPAAVRLDRIAGAGAILRFRTRATRVAAIRSGD